MRYDFYVISMTTANGKTLYLGESGRSLGWFFDYDKGVYFETYTEAEKFAKDYFKHFDKWEVKEVYVNI